MRHAGCASSGEEDIRLLDWLKGKKRMELMVLCMGVGKKTFSSPKKGMPYDNKNLKALEPREDFFKKHESQLGQDG